MMESKICGGESESSEVVEVPDDDDDATGQRSKDVGGHLRDQHSSDSGDDPKSRSNSSSQMIGLLSEFTKIYSDRLQRVEQSAMKSGDHQYLESKVCVLESWVRDLGEQNEVLVATVEELEKEAADRVALLEDRLAKMATTTRESCVSLRDHQLQVSTLVADKIGLERETQGMGDKLVNLELKNQRLKEENCNLQSDLNNLVQVISRARSTGQWVADDLTFSCVTPEQVFGPVLSSSRRSSQSLKDSQRDYINQMLEDQIKLGSSSTSSLSHFQEVDGSLYSGCGSDKDMLIMKLKGDLRYSQMAYEDVTCQLVERDKQIADLQARLTEIHHELAESQAEVSQSTRTLQELRHQNRHDSAEVTRKEEMIRNLLCKASKKDPLKCSLTSLCELDSAISESNMELQLNENIDILVSRLAELEDECQNLRDQVSTLQDSHSLCSPKINILQEKLSRSQQTQVELRTVLTAEVAERHDQVVSLKDQLKEQEQNHHDTQMQLQLRNEVIKDLRREIKEMKEKSIESPVEEEFDNCNVGTMSNETQTYQIDNSDKGVMTEPSSFSPPNGLYVSTTPHVSQVSKLQNELAEKSILLRELQSHLASSRQELNLKDETLSKLEQKLNTTRQEDGQKEERMHYLTGQLTSLQLEVGRTHGQAVQLRRQVDNKSEMLQKMESENSSLTKMLNEKSSTLEKYQSDILKISSDLDRKKKEVTDQRLTINSLQDALVSSKRTCDSLRMRLDSDLVESDARGDALREENRTLNRKVASLDEELKHYQRLETLQSGKVTREKERLRQQLEDAERRCQDATGTVRGLQDQVQTLEDELMTKTEAEGRVAELQRKNLKLQETLSAQETSESVERLGAQLAKTVAALTEFREEAHSKEEHLRQAKQDISQLSDALAYEKELNTSLHDQMESLVEVAGSHECKSAEQQQELRKIVRDSVQKDRQMSTLKAEIEGFKSQIRDLEDLVADEQKEVSSLNDSMNSESKILLQTRSKLDAARKENLKGEEKITNLQRELQHSQEKITRLEQQIKEMESERETEVTSVAERLTATHEASVRRLEDTLLSYTRLQARDEYQVENLEESLREFGRRLAESELHTKEVEREREALNRNLRQEQRRRENDAQEYQRQIMRITEEMSLLKVRLEGVQEETLTWQRQCEDLEERHQLAEGGKGFPLQLQKFQHQVENLKDALLTTKLDARKAEEERGHAHEQVLSLIRECNNLEEQIHHLTKEKCRLQDRLLCKESDITLLVKENVAATAKDEHDSTERATRMEREKSSCLTETADAENFVSILRQQLTEAQMEIRRLKEGKVNGDGKENGQSLNICGGNGEITLYQLQSEIVAARRESSEARRMLLERESQGRMSQLKIDTLQRMLQDRQEEVSELEIKLNESQIKAHRVETEMAQLRAKVATLTTQLGHAQSLKRSSISSHASGQPGEVESLEHEVSALREEVTVKTDEINQLLEKETQNMARVRELQQDVTKITKSRDEANRKVVNLEGSLAEALESSTTTKSMEKMWEAQLASIQQEVSRLLCETTQLKECNVALHEQLSTSQSEGKHLRSEMRSKDVQLDELQHARDLLSNDVQVVVAAVKQWLHEQKTANSKLAGKLHQQNKHILHLNTEKQFLAERNTGLQKINHELSLQVQEFRVRLGLSFSSSPEKMNKLGGMTSTSGFLSPLLLSPLGVGGSSRVVSATPPLESGFMQSSDSAFGASIFSDRYEDAFSTCSSEGSSGGGCQVPGPDLPGALQLEQLAHLADSLLLASRNINRNSSNMKSHKSHKMTSATSLGDLTSTQGHHGISSLGNARKTSSSVGNLSVISPIDFKEKPSSPSSKFNYRYSDPSNFFCAGLKNNNKGNDLILPPPVRERKTYQRLFHTPSIEEADEEDGNYSVRLDSAPQIRLPSHEQSHKLHHNTERSQTSQSVANSEALDSTVSQNSQNVTRLPDCCMDESSL